MKLSDVLLAMEMADDNCKGFYDLVTKRIEWLDEFGMTREEYESAAATLDEHGFKRLPDLRDINEYHMTEDFADQHESADLNRAIRGRGAFRRFRSAVCRIGLEQAWFQFRDAEYKRIAKEWCEDCGIELEPE